LQAPKHNGQIDMPDGECLHSGDDLVEWFSRRPHMGATTSG
jgi:hypothetical protein